MLIVAQEFEGTRGSSPGFEVIRLPLRHPVVPAQARVPLATRLALLGYSRFVRTFLRLRARARGVDIVHSHFGNVACWYAPVATGLGTPHVVSFYGYDYGLLVADSTWRSRFERLFRSAAAFVCEGSYAADRLRRAGCPSEKIHRIPLGIEPRAAPSRQRSKPAGALKLLQIASFKEKKGHTSTVRAFARALRNRPNMSLTLVGAEPGPIERSLREMLRDEPAADRVTLLPAVPPDSLFEVMDAHDVLIQPSVHADNGDCEGGAPVVLLDAQGAGLPVIGTTHCDIPSLVLHEQTGLLVGEGELEALARAIERFYDMEADAFGRFSRAARAHVDAEFDVGSSAAGLEALYRGLIGAARPAP